MPKSLTSFILRSPLHRLMSGKTMLVTVIGRKTGNRYTTPVHYAQRNDRLYLVSRDDRTWWRNLRGGGAVSALVRGDSWTGVGRQVTGLDDIRRAQSIFDMTSLAGAAREPGAVLIEVILD